MSELDRLADENRELRSRVRHLANSSVSIEKRLDHVLADHARIEQRLQRVENSVIFRFLRWLGGRLRSVGVSVERGVPMLARTKDTADALDRNYSNWVEETLLQERLRTPPRSAPAAANSSPNHPPRISILLEAQ